MCAIPGMPRRRHIDQPAGWLQPAQPDILDRSDHRLPQLRHQNGVPQIDRVVDDQPVHPPPDARGEDARREHRRVHAPRPFVPLDEELRLAPARLAVGPHVGKDIVIIGIPLDVGLDGRHPLPGIGVGVADDADALIAVQAELDQRPAHHELLCFPVAPWRHDDRPLADALAVLHVGVPAFVNRRLAHRPPRFVFEDEFDEAVNVRPCCPPQLLLALGPLPLLQSPQFWRPVRRFLRQVLRH